MDIQHGPGRAVLRAGLSSLIIASCYLGTLVPTTAVRASAAPPRGGSLTVRFILPLNCIDPLKNGNAWFVVGGTLYDTLLSWNEHGRLRPGLATTWTFSHGGKWLTLTLRRGVHFTNGNQFDARTVQQIISLYAKTPSVAAIGETLSKTQVLNRYTVRLVLNEPLRTVLDSLAAYPMFDPLSEAQAGADSCVRPPAGTGPFMLKSYTPGAGIAYVRNPSYRWGPSWLHNKGPAYLASLNVKFIVNDATAVSALLAGDLDVARMPATEIDRVRGYASIVEHTFTENAELFLSFNAWRPPFDNPAIRRAIAEAIDRWTLLRVANGGYGTAAYSPIPPSVQFYDRNAEHYAPRYNPKDAQRVLAAHHVTGPFTLVTYTIPNFRDTAEVIQAELAKVGVQIKIVTKDDVTPEMVNGQFDLTVLIHRGNDLYADYYSGPRRPTRNWRVGTDKALESLILKGRHTIDARKARVVYAQAQQYMDKQVIIDPLFSRRIILAARSRVKGWHMATNFDPLSYPAFPDLYVTAR